MKKRYLKPQTSGVELKTNVVMNIVSAETGNVGVGNGSADGNSPILGKQQQHTWGDLWKKH